MEIPIIKFIVSLFSFKKDNSDSKRANFDVLTDKSFKMIEVYERKSKEMEIQISVLQKYREQSQQNELKLQGKLIRLEAENEISNRKIEELNKRIFEQNLLIEELQGEISNLTTRLDYQ